MNINGLSFCTQHGGIMVYIGIDCPICLLKDEVANEVKLLKYKVIFLVEQLHSIESENGLK